MYVIKRHDPEYPHRDLYLTIDNEYGLREEAVEFEGLRAAREIRDNQEYCNPYNSTGNYTYTIESD